MKTILSSLRGAREALAGDVSELPREIRQAAQAFSKKRFAYFENLAGLIESSEGKMSYLTMFEREAERYAGTPRGRLAAHWVSRMHETGARLSETWIGCVPKDELAVIAIAERRGRGAMVSALKDLSRVGRTIAEAKKAFVKSVSMSMVGMLIATAMVLAMPFFFRPFFQESFGFMPVEFHGPMTRRYYLVADVVSIVWWFVIPAVLGAFAWVAWSMPNWTGPRRQWCDEHIVFYKLYRDFKGALFLATFASLTKSTGAEVTSQRSALLMMQEQVQPWLRWKIQMILSRMDDQGAHNPSIFDVGVVDKEIFYRICDVLEARGLSEGLVVAGRDSEEKAVSSIQMRGAAVSFGSMAVSLVIVLGSLLWVYVVVFEFKNSIGTWANQ